MSNTSVRSGVANLPKLERCASPQACTWSPVIGERRQILRHDRGARRGRTRTAIAPYGRTGSAGAPAPGPRPAPRALRPDPNGRAAAFHSAWADRGTASRSSRPAPRRCVPGRLSTAHAKASFPRMSDIVVVCTDGSELADARGDDRPRVAATRRECHRRHGGRRRRPHPGRGNGHGRGHGVARRVRPHQRCAPGRGREGRRANWPSRSVATTFAPKCCAAARARPSAISRRASRRASSCSVLGVAAVSSARFSDRSPTTSCATLRARSW